MRLWSDRAIVSRFFLCMRAPAERRKIDGYGLPMPSEVDWSASVVRGHYT